MDNQLIVLNLQAGAAILMGIDYFVPKAVMKRLGKTIRSQVQIFRTGFTAQMLKDLYLLLESHKRSFRLLIPVSLLGFSVYELRLYEHFETPLLKTLLFYLSVVLACAFVFALTLVLLRSLPFCVGAVIFILLFFIDRSPKGPLAAVGMVLLCASIVLRYFGLSPVIA